MLQFTRCKKDAILLWLSANDVLRLALSTAELAHVVQDADGELIGEVADGLTWMLASAPGHLCQITKRRGQGDGPPVSPCLISKSLPQACDHHPTAGGPGTKPQHQPWHGHGYGACFDVRRHSLGCPRAGHATGPTGQDSWSTACPAKASRSGALVALGHRTPSPRRRAASAARGRRSDCRRRATGQS